jgi:hypothetical protein
MTHHGDRAQLRSKTSSSAMTCHGDQAQQKSSSVTVLLLVSSSSNKQRAELTFDSQHRGFKRHSTDIPIPC